MRLECYCIRGGNYARNDEGGGKGAGLDRVPRAGRTNSSTDSRVCCKQTDAATI